MAVLPVSTDCAEETSLASPSDEALIRRHEELKEKARTFELFKGTTIPGISVRKHDFSQLHLYEDTSLPAVLSAPAAARFPALVHKLERFRELLLVARRHQWDQGTLAREQFQRVEGELQARGWRMLQDKLGAVQGDCVTDKRGIGLVAELARVSISGRKRLQVEIEGTRLRSTGELGKSRYKANLDDLVQLRVMKGA